MTKLLLPLALTLAASSASAAGSGVGYGGSVGALTMVTHGLATNANEVRQQGGFVTAGAVRWTLAPEARQKVSAARY